LTYFPQGGQPKPQFIPTRFARPSHHWTRHCRRHERCGSFNSFACIITVRSPISTRMYILTGFRESLFHLDWWDGEIRDGRDLPLGLRRSGLRKKAQRCAPLVGRVAHALRALRVTWRRSPPFPRFFPAFLLSLSTRAGGRVAHPSPVSSVPLERVGAPSFEKGTA